MKKVYCVILIIVISFKVYSQTECDCDHFVENLSANSLNVINGSSFDYSPGDVFCIKSGNYAGIRFINFKGDKNNPILFKNTNGVVSINEATYPAIELSGNEYVRFSGDGCDDVDYGFELTSNSTALSISTFSSDIEVDHVKVNEAGFAGIMAKTDPNCNNPKTWRRNGYVLKNLSLHDNYIKDTEGEGFYIGATHGYKVSSTVKCGDEYVFPHWLEDVRIYNNKIENAGWDGIQVNMVRRGGKVYQNTIIGYGETTDNGYQKFGMSIGGGVYEVYNNYIKNTGTGKGLQFISVQSETKIFNNVIISPKSDAIFLHSRHLLDGENGYYVMNNTIINPENSGIKLITVITESVNLSEVNTMQLTTPFYFMNNVIVNPGNEFENGGTWKGVSENYIDFNAPEEKEALKKYISSNYTTKNIKEVGFKDYQNDMYEANDTSGIIDSGEDLVQYGVTFDFNNVPRPQNGIFDMGAYERKLVTIMGNEDEGDLVVFYPNPTDKFINIKTGESINSISIYTLDGKKVKSISADVHKVSVDEIPSGVYFLEVISGSKKQVVKLIKE